MRRHALDTNDFDATHFKGTTDELFTLHAMAIVDVYFEYYATKFAELFGEAWVDKQEKKRRLTVEDARWEKEHAQKYAMHEMQ